MLLIGNVYNLQPQAYIEVKRAMECRRGSHMSNKRDMSYAYKNLDEELERNEEIQKPRWTLKNYIREVFREIGQNAGN